MKYGMRINLKRLYIMLPIVGVLLLTGCDGRQRFTCNSHMLYCLEESDPTILVIQKGLFYGYGDINGNVLIKPIYEDARPFFEGLAAVKNEEKYGFIDNKGNIIIPFQYDDAIDFHNGKAIVGKDYFRHIELSYPISHVIDVEGKSYNEYMFTSISGFMDNVLQANTHEGEGLFLNEDYQPIDALRKCRISSHFSEGMAVFSSADNLYGYVDKNGNQVLPGKFVSANIFNDGLAAVMPDGEKKLWGYIDKTGKIVIPPAYSAARLFGEGLACVLIPEDKWIIIDTVGNEVADMQKKVYDAGVFSEGLCAVKTVIKRWKEDDLVLWGFTDTSGRIAIDFKYDEVTPFKNGIAQVLVDGHIGYIDKTGKYIWEPK